MRKTIYRLLGEAKKQKIDVKIIDAKSETLMLTKSNKKITISAGNYGWNPAPSSFICEEKMLTNRVLNDQGLSVSNGDILYDPNEVRSSWFLNKFKFPFVVKQYNGAQGKNFYKIEKKDDFLRAYNSLKRRNIKFIVEDFIEGKEYRFLVIKGKIIAVANRVPAHIKSDGKHNIRQLIEIKNKKISKNIKKYGGKNSLVGIKIDQAVLNFLKNKQLSLKSIPLKNQTIFLRSNSNVSTGGESIDYTDKYNQKYKEICQKIFKAMPKLMIVGIDIITKDAAKNPFQIGYRIIEINSQPGIDIHEFSAIGKPKNVARRILDVMFED